MEGTDGEETEGGYGDGDEDHGGHAEHRAPGQVDVGVTQQTENQSGDEDHLESERQDGEHVELVDMPGGCDVDGQGRDDEGLERIEADLGPQQRGPEHRKLGEEDHNGRDVGHARVGRGDGRHQPPPA